jgi:hypothetical protein
MSTADVRAEIVGQLQVIEERLRDLAYDRLREAASEDGDADAAADEKRLLQARRAIERAIRALGGGDEWE